MKFTVTSYRKVLLGACAIAAIVGSAQAQTSTTTTITPLDGFTPPVFAPGTPAGSYALSGFDNVDLYNGHLNFALPLLRIQGRGTAGYEMTLLLESIWTVGSTTICTLNNTAPEQCSTGYFPAVDWWDIIKVGYGPGRLLGRFLTVSSGGPCADFTVTKLTFRSPDGTEHELRDTGSDGAPVVPQTTSTNLETGEPICASVVNRGPIWVAKDESGIKYVASAVYSEGQAAPGSALVDPPSGQLFFRDGTIYNIDSFGKVASIQDRNGNEVNFQYDSSDRVTSLTDSDHVTNVSYADANGLGYDDIQFTGENGTSRHIKVFHEQLHQALRFDFSAVQNIGTLFPELTVNLANGVTATQVVDGDVISSVQLPNQQSYQFFYDPYVQISRVVLPTGGAIEYDYASGVSGSVSGVLSAGAGGGPAGPYRRVTARRTYTSAGSNSSGSATGVPEGVQIYSLSTVDTETNVGIPFTEGAGTMGQTTVTLNHVDGSRNTLFTETHALLGDPIADLLVISAYPSWKEGKEVTANEAGLTSAANTFAQGGQVSWFRATCSSGPCLDFEPPSDPHLIQTDTTLLDISPNQLSRHTRAYDSFSNVTDTGDYDFGTGGSPGPLLRQTHTDYVTDSNYVSNSVYMPSLPTLQRTLLGSTIYEQTQYEYDVTADGTCAIPNPGVNGPCHAPLVS